MNGIMTLETNGAHVTIYELGQTLDTAAHGIMAWQAV